MKRLFLLLAFIVISLSPPSSNTKAVSLRSCPLRTPGTPCFEYGVADVVFIGTALEVKKTNWDGPPPAYWMPYKQVIARLSIDEAFKGIEGTEVVFEMGQCPYYFEEGTRYLVYSRRRSDGKLEQHENLATRPVNQAEPDIQYIRSLRGTPPKGTIQAGVYRNTNGWKPWPLIRDWKNYPEEPIPGIKIVIESPQHKFEGVTNDSGTFEFKDVPAGNYRVGTTIPNNLGVLGLRGDLKVTGHGCFSAGFNVVPRGQLSGRVFDSEGLPVPGVRVYFFSPEGVTEEVIENINKKKMEIWEIHSLDTDSEGRFKVQGVPKGNYIIAVNVIRDTRKSKEGLKPYPRTFYPGVPNFSQAKVISLDEGEIKQNLDIKLPPETIPK